MKNTKYIDCFAAVGKWSHKDQDAPWTVEQMLADMERCEIHGALIYSHLAADLNPTVGNHYVAKLCQKHERLIPCWIAMPHHVGDFPVGDKFVQQMADYHVKAVKLFPRSHKFSLHDRTSGMLLSALQEAGIPVCFDRGDDHPAWQQIDWDEIEPLFARYPNLKVILHRMRWESTRRLIPLMQEFPNLHVEFSNYQANRILELLVEKVGADQLLFGTEMMQKSPGAAKAYIDYADISDGDREKIAGANIMRLLKLDTPPADYSHPEPKDVILQKALRAEPIDDMEVIDAHAHQMAAGAYDNAVVPMPASDTAGIVDRNKRIGVDITIVSSWIGIWNDYEMGNEVTRESIATFPDNIIGYATLDPTYVKDWPGELRRCHEQYGMKGMKPYFPRNGVPYNDKRYNEWYTYGNQHKLFSLMHWSANFLAEMEDIATRFPKISFLLAHSGRWYQAARDYCRLANKFPNVYCEITYTAVSNHIIEFMVREAGSEKVIYGSDTCMRDPFPQFGWVAYADISEEDKRNILGRNMRKIIDRCC